MRFGIEAFVNVKNQLSLDIHFTKKIKGQFKLSILISILTQQTAFSYTNYFPITCIKFDIRYLKSYAIKYLANMVQSL